MSSPITVNVIAKDYAYGLKQDAGIIIDLLNASGFEAKFKTIEDLGGEGVRAKIDRRIVPLQYALTYRFLPHFYPKREVNIFLEQFPVHMLPCGRRQVLIPNQEWFVGDMEVLKKFDLVICKTRVAEEIFSQQGCRTALSSFTSIDRRLSPPPPKRREFLMITGAWSHVERERVFELWARHPEWPGITISSWFTPTDAAPPNVRLLRDFVSKEEIIRLQNEHLFHLCVTTAEGFGHKFNEGFSCGAIVIATDGPPMNEIVQPDRGLLVKWNKSNPLRLGTEYHFDEADLERTIELALRLKPEEIATMTSNGRKWYEENDRSFRQQLPLILKKLMAEGA
jgi:hypothetical protein